MSTFYTNISSQFQNWEKLDAETLYEAQLKCIQRYRPMSNCGAVIMIASGFNELGKANLLSVRNARINSKWVNLGNY